MAAISGIARLDKGWVDEGSEEGGQMETELKRRKEGGGSIYG